jgi:hypothetical protein
LIGDGAVSGNARAAIDALVELAAGKVGLGSSRTLAERTPTQVSTAAGRILLGQPADASML